MDIEADWSHIYTFELGNVVLLVTLGIRAQPPGNMNHCSKSFEISQTIIEESQ
jgi:hypothetical protein